MQDKLLSTIIDGLQDSKAHNIQIIDMRKLEDAAFQYFVVCEGTSSTQVSGIANTLTKHVQDSIGQRNQDSVGMSNCLWVAIDYGYILVHIFQPEVREFYSLETLWEDARITKIEEIE